MRQYSAYTAAASDLAGRLQALLLRSGRLLDGTAGSISMVDATRQRYSKSAEHGASCRLGAVFPLDEGVTGQVVARRRPVVLVRYSDLRAGHLSDHPARHGAVAAVPLWWRGDVVGANVLFAGRSRHFTAAEVDELELLTQVAVPGILRAGADRAVLAHLDRGRHDVITGPTEAVQVRPAPPSPLTPREQQTLGLMARGLTNHQIATALGVSAKTVEKHVGAVLTKADAGSRTGAVVTALQRGWVAGEIETTNRNRYGEVPPYPGDWHHDSLS